MLEERRRRFEAEDSHALLLEEARDRFADAHIVIHEIHNFS